MTSRKGGYIIIDLTSTTLVDDLSKALGFGKPVLVYNANNEANFYTLTYADNVYTLTGAKDGFTINSMGTITPVISDGKKYIHKILFSSDEYQFSVDVLSSKSTALTLDEIKTSAYLQSGLANIIGETESYPSIINILNNGLFYGFNYLDSNVAKYASDTIAYDNFNTISDVKIIEI